MKKGKNRTENRRPNGGYFDPMSITWTEKYDKQISIVWNAIPESVSKIIATVAIFLLGISINGDWIAVWVHTTCQLGIYQIDHAISNNSFRWNEFSLEYFRLKNLWSFWWPSCAISYGMYFITGGFIHISLGGGLFSTLYVAFSVWHAFRCIWRSLKTDVLTLKYWTPIVAVWYYYVRRRHKPEEWKCQPQKWLSPELERNEILWGSTTLFLNASMSSILSCYIANGGYSTVYYTFNEYGWFWFILQFPLVFIYQDYFTYWLHRIYHMPFFYKRFHKLHHRYKQPTVFSVTAIHPVESIHIQLCLATPLFLIPCHWLPFYTSTFYAYYHGIIDHSGVNFKSFWWQPWQPDAIFHDNHHQYFHVNFAFNIIYWDKLHGTYRRKDRIYNEDIYYGIGKSLESASEKELQADIEQRDLENPLAYRTEMPYKFSRQEKKKLRETS